MKIIKIIPLGMILFLTSCVKNEMKISRTDKTIVSELVEQSPIYITKKDDGSMAVNENNRIGNTDWVFSIERDLPLGSILPEVQRLKTKKYKQGMHPDSKKMYFIYLDTILNKPAYLRVDRFDFVTNLPLNDSVIKFKKNLAVEQFIQEMVKITSTDTVTEALKILVY